ncbi:MAG: hypothetical protein FJ009_10105 [Chloroflexi bacterium]|nr:hypothetical protein [Chloroflexota bacterium]
MSDVEQVIDIRDPEINVEEIMARIRERLRQRRAQASAQGLDYDRLVDDERVIASGALSADLYYDLHQLRTTAESIWVPSAMRDRHFPPLLNALLFRTENLFHRLALKYVNMLAGRQVVFNRAATSIVTSVLRQLEQDDAHIETLEKQVKELRERLAKIEQSAGVESNG